MNKHLIEVRYIPASARKPARISLTSHWNEDRFIFSSSGPLPIAVQARIELQDMGFACVGEGKMKRGHFIIVNEFKSLKGN
jgi:hypothetical protein